MGFKLNAEVSSNSSGLLGASPQLSFYHKNLFNGGERLNLEFTGNWQFMPGTDVASTELGVSASLSFPRAPLAILSRRRRPPPTQTRVPPSPSTRTARSTGGASPGSPSDTRARSATRYSISSTPCSWTS